MAIKRGTAGSDKITGTSSADDLYGLGGADSLSGGGGNDRLWGGSGIDALFGGDGADQIYGEGSGDYMSGGNGNDYLHGGSGNDRLRGDAGNDILNGAGGENDLAGGAGSDTLIHYARAGDGQPGGTARYDGGTGTDTLKIDIKGTFNTEYGDPASHVSVYASSDGRGTIGLLTDPDEGDGPGIGTFAGIEIFRLASSDHAFDFHAFRTATVYGGNADDRLEGGEGNQTFIGGAGADDYRFLWREGWNGGTDKVIGFSVAEGDAIGFSNRPEDQSGPETEITSVERNGHTILTTKLVDSGAVVHTVDIDTVGIPEWYEDYYLG
jgi:Ca2+-binding RTX toxin-like protein